MDNNNTNATELRFAVRLGFGHEGHGKPIVFAHGATSDACEESAQEALQDEFGGLWTGKMVGTVIGRVEWLEKHFGRSAKVAQAIDEYRAHEGL